MKLASTTFKNKIPTSIYETLSQIYNQVEAFLHFQYHIIFLSIFRPRDTANFPKRARYASGLSCEHTAQHKHRHITEALHKIYNFTVA
jgi:hypothetical protein